MRILQLTSHLNVGGITTYVVNLSSALAKRGHEVAVASGGGQMAAHLAHAGVPHWRLPLATSAEFSPQVAWAWWQLAHKLSEHPVELIHAHTRVAQVVAHGLWRRARVPYVTTWHGFYRNRFFRRWLPCTGMRTMAISQPVAAQVRESFGLPPERIRLIPHGVDVERFEQPLDQEAIQRLRTRLQLPPNGPVVGTIARLVPSKGVDRLLEGFRHIRVRLPQATLLIVGDGAERAHLGRLAKRLGFAQAVRFAGAVAETRALLSLMDVFVFLPATQEGFGLSLLEAMASGRPIVAIRRGGGASWVLEEHANECVVIDPDDPARLGEAVVRVLTDSSYAGRLASQAREAVKARYDFARMVSQVEDVYAAVREEARLALTLRE